MTKRVAGAREPTGIKAIRWVSVISVSDDDLAPFGVVEVTGWNSDGLAEVDVPSADSLDPGKVLLLGSIPLRAGDKGRAHADYPAAARITGSPVAGNALGTVSGQTYLSTGKTGFVCLGGVSGGRANVSISPAGAAAGGGSFVGSSIGIWTKVLDLDYTDIAGLTIDAVTGDITPGPFFDIGLELPTLTCVHAGFAIMRDYLPAVTVIKLDAYDDGTFDPVAGGTTSRFASPLLFMGTAGGTGQQAMVTWGQADTGYYPGTPGVSALPFYVVGDTSSMSGYFGYVSDLPATKLMWSIVLDVNANTGDYARTGITQGQVEFWLQLSNPAIHAHDPLSKPYYDWP